MNITQQRAYHDSLKTDFERAYKTLLVLFTESHENAVDNTGQVIDESSMCAHKNYAQAVRDLGSVLELMDKARGTI